MRMYQKLKSLFFFSSPTTEAVGSNLCNIPGTNGFSRWSTTQIQAEIRLHGLMVQPHRVGVQR